MTGVSSAVLISLVLVALLFLIWRRAALAARELPMSSEPSFEDAQATLEICPAEYVRKIFSRADWEFISQMKSPHLRQFFLQERKAVALHWVQQTSSAIRRIMREHAAVSRQTRDLELSREVRIFLQYAELQLICGMLFLSIEVAGPQRLGALALYADELFQRIGQASRAFESTGGPSAIRSLGSS